MRQFQSTNDPPGSGVPSAGGQGQGASGGFAAASVPTNITVPVISGTPQVGSLLTASPGIWNNSPASFAYQWKSSGTNVGTNQNNYTPAAGDIGNTITVSVTAMNSAGNSSPATSAATAVITSGTAGMLNFSQASDSILIGAVVA
jgi:hypothetical protein